ncbi:PH domain-containing protein [Agrococcus sp. 1P02AA]|uniref:PH domain-containing protein n=1 Tax=Agrococcus sp. 1P02AA TaxID=3132259 RepID=UPI0039A494DE
MQGAHDAPPDDAPAALPPVGEPGAHHRPPQAQRLSHVMTAIGTLIMVALALGALAIFRTELAATIVLAIALPLVAVIAVLDFTVGNRWEQRYYTYTVTDDYVYITSGRFVRTTTTMPTPHIIAVETQQGPVQRAFGLLSVRFTTITGQQELGPLAPAEAERIRDRVTRALHAHGDA